MENAFHLLVCSIYQKECDLIFQSEGWKNAQLHTFPQVCRHPQLRRRAAEKIRQVAVEHAGSDLLVCECFAVPESLPAGLPVSQVRCLDQCMHMVLSPSLVDHYISQGAYLLTPGWLNDWPSQIKSWGMDQPTARMFFHEFAKKLVLLDTLVNPLSAEQLAQMGDFLDLPVEIIPVGTDYLRLYLQQLVAGWQAEKKLLQTQVTIAEVNRKLADYAMAFDLLTRLTQIKNEAEAVETILDLFSMLFSPGSIAYHPQVENLPEPDANAQLDDEDLAIMRRWQVDGSEQYAWTSSGTGFFLRFRHKSDTLGILRVDDIKLIQYKHQYLNLALSIAHLCGLTISNARTFQRLQEAETVARWEKEISETLREILSELTLQRDQDLMLEHILISLARVSNYSDAAVFMLEGARLTFMAGQRLSLDGQQLAFPAPEQPLLLDETHLFDQSALIEHLRASSVIQDYLGAQELPGWINVPLILRGELVGFLSLGSKFASTYNDSEATLLQSFADEVTIAIENARLFKEIQTLAVTDGLTGLFNRRHFYHLANLEFKRSDRYQRPLSLLMMDIDLFKRINDTHGHLIGDRVLKNVAQNLLQKGRSGDIAGRYGGEEFVMLLPETNEASALALAERLRGMIAAAPLLTDQGPVSVTLSLGVAAKDESCDNLEELLRRSDEALYAAKHSGRNCVRVWKPA